MFKYAAEGTTMTFDKVDDPAGLTFPGIYLCPSPGFKAEEIEKISDLENPWLVSESSNGPEKVTVIFKKIFSQHRLLKLFSGPSPLEG